MEECSQIIIKNDDIYEADEQFNVTCFSCDDRTTIIIQDGDSKYGRYKSQYSNIIAVFLTHVDVSVALERSSYTVEEGNATTEVCALLHGSTDVTSLLHLLSMKTYNCPIA